MNNPINIFKFNSEIACMHNLISKIGELANISINQKGNFNLIISGGSSVIPIFKELSKRNEKWQNWRVFWVDERCVPLESEFRNDKDAYEHWLKNVSIPKNNIYPIPAHMESQKCLKLYSDIITSYQWEIDLALLGIGTDGHVASLFPENMPSNLKNTDLVIYIDNSPKVPLERVSLNYHCLCKVSNVIFIAKIEDKKSAIEKLQRGDKQIPAGIIKGKASTQLYYY